MGTQNIPRERETPGRVGSARRVTIVIPTFNRASLLSGAIESALAQPFSQVVVSDNVSEDGTPDVVRTFDDPRLSYLRLDRHLGLNEHFNLWLERAETEYLFMLPDDDRMAPDLVAKALPFLNEHPRVGFVHGQVNVVAGDGGLIAGGHGMTGLFEDTIETGAEFIRRSMAMSYRVHASTALIRTAAIAGVRLDERDFPVTDFGLWLRLALEWDVAYLAQPLATYRIHCGTYSSEAAAVTEGGYIQGAERIVRLRDAKLRFLAEQASRLADADGLRASALRAFRKELVAEAAHATERDRRPVPTARALARCVRLAPSTAADPAAWRLFAGSLLGRRGISFVKRLIHRPRPSAGAA